MPLMTKKVVLWVLAILFLFLVLAFLATQLSTENPVIKKLINLPAEYAVE